MTCQVNILLFFEFIKKGEIDEARLIMMNLSIPSLIFLIDMYILSCI